MTGSARAASLTGKRMTAGRSVEEGPQGASTGTTGMAAVGGRLREGNMLVGAVAVGVQTGRVKEMTGMQRPDLRRSGLRLVSASSAGSLVTLPETAATLQVQRNAWLLLCTPPIAGGTTRALANACAYFSCPSGKWFFSRGASCEVRLLL